MPTSPLSIDAHEEIWPLRQSFRISRGSRTEAQIVVLTVGDGNPTVAAKAFRSHVTTRALPRFWHRSNRYKAIDFNRQNLQGLLPAGAARNALDCALWDLEAKTSGQRAWELAEIPIVPEVETSFTISLDTPEKMGEAAKASARLPILKLKLGGDDPDLARIEAVRGVAPTARLLIDANESWSPEHYQKIVPALKQLGVELIEQPFPAKADEVLETLDHPIPVAPMRVAIRLTIFLTWQTVTKSLT